MDLKFQSCFETSSDFTVALQKRIMFYTSGFETAEKIENKKMRLFRVSTLAEVFCYCSAVRSRKLLSAVSVLGISDLIFLVYLLVCVFL